MAKAVSVDMHEVEELERMLGSFDDKMHRYAVRNTLNDMAVGTMRLARKVFDRKFINRNQFSQRLIRFEKAQLGPVWEQESTVGSVIDRSDGREQGKWMEEHEAGAIRRPQSGSTALDIATTDSSGEGRQSTRRRTQIARRRIGREGLELGGKRITEKDPRLYNLIAIKRAVRKKYRWVHLKRTGNKRSGRIGREGIFRLTNWKKSNLNNNSAEWAKRTQTHALDMRSSRIPKRPWLLPAWKLYAKKMPAIYKKRLIEQLKRAGARL